MPRGPPTGAGWPHEPKFDGWRIQLAKAGELVALLTRNGHDCAPRLPKAFRAIPARSCIIDKELVTAGPDRPGNIWTLQRAIGAGREDEIGVLAFDG